MSLFPVTFIGAGPGDPELITVKGQKALQKADLVLYAGSLVSNALLTWAENASQTIDTSPLTLEDIVQRMVQGYRAGQRVVRVHSGDPALYGAVHEQFQRLDREGVPYEVVPGVTAAFATAASMARELTLPEIAQTVILTRAAGRTPVPEGESLASLAAHRATMAIYLSIKQIRKVTEELSTSYGPDTPVVVAYRVSWPEEKIIHGTLQDICEKVEEAGITRQALILVGDALNPAEDLKGKRSRLYHHDFRHGFRA